MTFASRTLIALAIIAPTVNALDVKDDDLKIGLKLQLQVRAQKAWASDAAGSRYDVSSGTAAEPDDVDFYVRRARIGFAGTWKDEYRFAYILRNDDQDRNGLTTRGPVTNVAYLEKVWKNADTGTEQALRAGLDYAFFNGTSAVFASSSQLFPCGRATEMAPMLAPRGVGVGYKYSTPKFTVGADIQNNSTTSNTTTGGTVAYTGDSASAAGDGPTDGGEGLFYGVRIQGIVYDDQAKPHMKPVESFIGAEGTGLLMSAEIGMNRDDNVGANQAVNTRAWGVEALFHHNAITALAEYRQAKAEVKNAAVADTEEDRVIYLAQVGYAIQVGDKVIEPALRWTRIDLNDDTEESAEYGLGEYGLSGYQTEIGVNYYIHKHNNKVQLALQHWRGENGGASSVGESKADIIRAQWGLSF